MTVSSDRIRGLCEAVADAVIAAEPELTHLDQAIGDGDHGYNMKRGFAAVRQQLDDIAAKPPGEALKAVGMQLVMNVGGASGPLYGTLFMETGKALGEDEPGRAALADALAAGIDGVRRRGKSDTGMKTMLDVLAPVLEALRRGAGCAELARTADEAAEATAELVAQKGRASFLGERSRGHVDPGARSSAVITNAVCRHLEAAS